MRPERLARRRRPGSGRTRGRPRRRRRAGRRRRGGRCRRSDPMRRSHESDFRDRISTAASAVSGRRAVREPTTESYCSNAQRLEAMLGEPSSAIRMCEGSSRSAERPALSATRSPERVLVAVDPARGLLGLQVVQRALVHQGGDGDVADLLAVVQHAQRGSLLGHLADRGGAGLPLSQSATTSSTRVGLDDGEHPLLGLGDHHLEGLQVGLAQRHPAHVDLDRRPRPRRPSRRPRRSGPRRPGPGARPAARRPAAPASTRAASTPRRDRRSGPSAAWRRRRPRARPRRAPRRRRSRPGRWRRRTGSSTLPAPGCGRADHPLGLGDPDAHRVDQAVVLVGRLEVDLAADGRHPDRVAVVADARRPRPRTGSGSARRSARRSAG